MDLAAFQRDGAAHFLTVLGSDAVARLREQLEPELKGRPGRRLTGGLDSVLPALTDVASRLIGPAAFPVRAVVFDKTSETNWSVAWHQDRTIAVRERRDAQGYGPWSVKDDIPHVEPPISVMAGMVTLRLHLDDCENDNAPLTVALGSHAFGRVPAPEVAGLARSLPNLACCARAGDVWAYSTLILHMSERSRLAGRRRVVQVDYSAEGLPGDVRWRGL
ncbi:phytanoyl-CoA dioxygenase PhyH family protein [Asticcacaulis biprosthecium C19]|uniref:Phytanoyl-CoA dioxygenase PhyH family protein n=1 Tax=Asticcacaulis biprosthecium C19 TaxID=715226 RepID=F4QKT6_9CAUL|nr:phytanoyl-CoA dioxygenase family protein [Asticcacaulis biprosthecium]EGF93388.1 phytanoyl-CoA dioxygenase PhyH family protein [Asticcacaulis biprosthecium C19]